MGRTDRLSAFMTQAFMDSGRVADEFQPGLRKQIRTDVLVLLVSGIVLIAGGTVGILFFQQYLVATILLVVGAILVIGAVVLWWISG